MRVLGPLILATLMASVGACGLLNEKNEGALASTYSSLYAFFETVSSDQAGCYPTLNNNNTLPPTTVRAMYSFQIERPKTLVVCVKNTTDTTGISNNNTILYGLLTTALENHKIDFFVSNAKINPGSIDIIDNIRIPNVGAITGNPVMGQTSIQCPFNASDDETFLVGRYNMDNLTDYQYIIAADESCGMCVGTGLSPFALARQYGVTY